MSNDDEHCILAEGSYVLLPLLPWFWELLRFRLLLLFKPKPRSYVAARSLIIFPSGSFPLRLHVPTYLHQEDIFVQSSETKAHGLVFQGRYKAKIRYVFLDSGDHNSKVMPDSEVRWMQQGIKELEKGLERSCSCAPVL